MKNKLNLLLIAALTTCAFAFVPYSENTNPSSQDDIWYLCTNCCRTKRASNAPWENGCRESSSGMHNYQFCGHAGDFNYTCRNCDAEVYLTSSQSPSASKCCATGGTHSWYHRSH